MTTLTQTSVIKTQPSRHFRGARSLYQIVVNAEDGNYEQFEIEAASFSEAEQLANVMAHETMTDIIFIEIYKIL